MLHPDLLNTVTEAYLDVLYATERPESGDPEDVTPEEFDAATPSPELLYRAKRDCWNFMNAALPLLAAPLMDGQASLEQVGNDFLYTRNGHGVGFWDREECYGDAMDALTTLADTYGTVYAYVGDDGQLYT